MRISDWSSDVCSSDLANLDIAQAKARLRQAREALVQSRADYLPSVTGSANAGRDFDSDAKDRSSFGLGADASWEVDIFGGISRSVEAARADEAATYYNLANVRTAIIAAVAINRSEEHTSELQSLMRISYAVFCLHTYMQSINNTTIPPS